MKTGSVFNIQRFSLNDGPGIRTTVFMKGCTLRCRWCHNPEGLSPGVTLQYLAAKCIGCRACEGACPNGVHRFAEGHTLERERCVGCGKCAESCPAGALLLLGKSYTAEELTAEIVKDLAFYRDTGGVTFSGGEPLMQADFIAETAALCRAAGVPSVAVDTAGNVPRSQLAKVLPLTDLFLYDIKAPDALLHRRGTGVENGRILENLYHLDGLGKRIWIRVPLIGGFNDAPETVGKINDLIAGLRHVERVTYIPFHTLGREKYESVGLASRMDEFYEPSEEKIAACYADIEAKKSKIITEKKG